MKFGELSEKEKQKFTEEVNKSSNKTVDEKDMQLWPEDDESMVKSYFKNE